MSDVHHTPHPFLGTLTAAAVNSRLSELDAALEEIIAGGTVAAASSVLSAQATIGQPNLVVVDGSNFSAGQTVYIGHASGSYETGTIGSVLADTITLTANLGNTYAAGTPVTVSPVEVVGARGSFATLLARLDASLWLNVKGYGAIGDGVTDDTAAINAAITAANAAGGGTVLIPDNSTFVVTSVQMKSHVHLRGNGYGSVIKIKDASDASTPIALQLDGVEHATISDLRVDGNKANQTQPGGVYTWGYGIGTSTVACSDCLIERVWVHDVLRTGIYLVGSRNKVQFCTVTGIGKAGGISIVGKSGIVTSAAEDCVVSYNVVDDTFEYGIKFYGGGNRARVVGNLISNSDSIGIWIDDCNAVRVAGNSVLNAGTQGIQLTADAADLTECSVVDNHVKNSGVHGILVWNKAATTLRDTRVALNHVEGCVRSGIIILGALRSVVEGNTCIGNASDTIEANHGGIEVTTSPNSVIANNICANNGNASNGFGINLLDSGGVSSPNTIISGNRCYDDGGGKQRYGLRVGAAGDNLTIIGNDLAGNVISALQLDGTPTASIVWLNKGWVTRNSGVASKANAATITHGLAATPTRYGVTSTVAKHIASITAVSATTLTLALYDDTGSAVAVAENVAWWAEV